MFQNILHSFQASSSPGNSKLAENIKKFKDRKQSEAKQKHVEEKEKKHNLLKLREQKKADQRAQNEKIKGSRTSSKFNKVREDVISKGRNQCDNDDYGFESGSADSFYDKLMKKYEANPGKRLIHIVSKIKYLLFYSRVHG